MGIHDDGDDVDDDYFDTDEVIILSWHGSTVAIHPASNQRAAWVSLDCHLYMTIVVTIIIIIAQFDPSLSWSSISWPDKHHFLHCRWHLGRTACCPWFLRTQRCIPSSRSPDGDGDGDLLVKRRREKLRNIGWRQNSPERRPPGGYCWWNHQMMWFPNLGRKRICSKLGIVKMVKTLLLIYSP